MNPSKSSTAEQIDSFIAAYVSPGHTDELGACTACEAKAAIQDLLIRERLDERYSVRWLPDEGKWIECEADRIKTLESKLNKNKETSDE